MSKNVKKEKKNAGICDALFKRGFRGPSTLCRRLAHFLNLAMLDLFHVQVARVSSCYTLHLGLFRMHQEPFGCFRLHVKKVTSRPSEKPLLPPPKHSCVRVRFKEKSLFAFTSVRAASAAVKLIKQSNFQAKTSLGSAEIRCFVKTVPES